MAGVACTSMSTSEITLANVWSAAGVIVGFQVAAFTLRINREVAVRERRGQTWLPVADYVNLASLAITLVGVFVAPIIGLYKEIPAARALGLALVLLACYPFAVAGHYELLTFKHPKIDPKDPDYFPRHEKVAIAITLFAILAYILLVALY
jgi:hypothetical protein